MIEATLPTELQFGSVFSISRLFVKASVADVVQERVIAACLDRPDDPAFFWQACAQHNHCRFLSIPLAVLTSIWQALSALGQTLNTMTLGGLALAVGMLVDDATVEIENTTRNLEEGIPLHESILKTAQQIALPTLAYDTSAICCIVFIPVDEHCPVRPGRSVRSDGAGCRVRDAGVLPFFANDCYDHDADADEESRRLDERRKGESQSSVSASITKSIMPLSNVRDKHQHGN